MDKSKEFSKCKNHNSPKLWKKISLSFFALFTLLLASPAHGQGATAIIGPVTTLEAQSAPQTKQAVEQKISTRIATSFVSATLNAVYYFVRKFATDLAKYAALGAAGQKTLIFQEGIGEYIKNEAANSAADFIGQLGQPFGLGLCGFPDINFQVSLQIGLSNLFVGGSGYTPAPTCTWQQLKDGWSSDAFVQKYGRGGEKLIPRDFTNAVSVKNSDFGVAFSALARVEQISAAASANASLTRLVNDGVKDVRDGITGLIRTPSNIVREELKGVTAKDELDKALLQVSATYATRLVDVIPMAAQIFLGTFLNEKLKTLLSPNEGLVPGTNEFAVDPFDVVRLNRQRVASALTDFDVVRIVERTNYNLLGELSTCPTEASERRTYNCTIDDRFVQALSRASQGAPLTIREAVEAGYLRGDWPLISPRRPVDNQDPNCYTRGYCYSNIQKLRKARILPLGFELAALKANPDNPESWTLERVMNNFNNCAPGNRPSPQHPYCGLINPNWVIRSFAASCQLEVFGESSIADGLPARARECADMSTCLASDSSGACLGTGFCTKEKNQWSLKADYCPVQFASCRTYAGENGEIGSYLSRTIDYGTCSAANVGCRAYVSEKNPDGTWINSSLYDENLKIDIPGRNQVYYFNNEITSNTCSESAEGCTRFYLANKDLVGRPLVSQTSGRIIQSNEQVYLKKAPDYLGCYDANLATDEVDYPETIAQIAETNADSAACGRFAQSCVLSEVGCESYTNVADRSLPAIPGQIEQSNVCASACVGYDTYREMSTVFDSGRFPLHFIPSSAASCEARYEGCSEFTNLESATRGGESLAYFTAARICDRPNERASDVYYSWEGSDATGYVLRTHNLRSVDDNEFVRVTNLLGPSISENGGQSAPVSEFFAVGSPAYYHLTATEFQSSFAACNEADYELGIASPLDPNRADFNCRALYDEEGRIFYRLLPETVLVDASCSVFRKSSPSFVVDAGLSGNQSLCQAAGGNWQTDSTGIVSTCQRCVAGGRFENGSCIYQILPSESGRCPAVANGCRAYVGNTGRNVNDRVIYDDFESDDASLQTLGYTGQSIAISNEAIYVNGRSLRFDFGAVGGGVLTKNLDTSILSANSAYEFSFWARAVGGTPRYSIVLRQGNQDIGNFTVTDGTANPVPIGPAWREYRFGPISISSFVPDQPLTLVFLQTPGSTSGQVFIDSLRLTTYADRFYLRSNSWNTPTACDANQTDSLPGAALGCQAYENSKKQIRYVTGFSSICREAAVGCEAVFETNNTSNPSQQVFNLWCRATAGQQTCTITLDSRSYTCSVPAGATGCLLSAEPILLAQDEDLDTLLRSSQPVEIRPETVVVPASSATPIFLTNRPEYTCRDSELGCTAFGLETRVLPNSTAPSAYNHNTVYLLNNSARYNTNGGSRGTLCAATEVGCSQFSSDGTLSYFKDPRYSGAGLCSYKTAVVRNGVTVDGWFFDGVGECSANTSLTCRSNSDCGVAGGNCINIGAVACYPSLSRRTSSGVIYDIQSNGNTGYVGHVGNCPASANTCTELVDPADRSEGVSGKSYFVLNNNKLKAKSDECGGEVSQVEGCVLFNDKSNPRRAFSSSESYAASENATPKFALVPARSASDTTLNDSNIVLKVDRDRICAEWLACRTYEVQVQQDGSRVRLCSDYRACNQLSSSGGCANWVDGRDPSSLEILNEENYISRPIGWNDVEYSGYSLLNSYQISNLDYIRFDFDQILRAARQQRSNPANISHLERLVDSYFLVYHQSAFDSSCTAPASDWTACGLPGSDLDGRCYSGKCYVPPGGRFPDRSVVGSPAPGSQIPISDLLILMAALEPASCKAHPEESSPYSPSKVALLDSEINFVGSQRGATTTRSQYERLSPFFESVNVCQDGEDCSCAYDKVTYQSGLVDYWPIDGVRDSATMVPDGLCTSVGVLTPQQTRDCQSGNSDTCIREGYPCDPTNLNSCGTGGVCARKTKVDTRLGLYGLCLERDISRPIFQGTGSAQYPCLTWLPIQVSASALDVFNSRPEAGYDPNRDARNSSGQVFGQLYCAQSTQVGSGLATYNASTARSDFTNTNNSFLRDYFSSGGLQINTSMLIQTVSNDLMSPIVDRGGQSGVRFCGDVNNINSPIIDRFCGSPSAGGIDIDDSQITRIMQNWAWRTLGTNASVLRIERRPLFVNPANNGLIEEALRFSGDYPFFTSAYNFLSESERGLLARISFYRTAADYMRFLNLTTSQFRNPQRLFSRDFRSPGNQNSILHLSRPIFINYGFMHEIPVVSLYSPRTWGLFGQGANLEQRTRYLLDTTFELDDSWENLTLSSPFLGAERGLYPSTVPCFVDRFSTTINPNSISSANCMDTTNFSPAFSSGRVHDSFIVNSPLETTLKESDLDRIYFVPTLYPRGISGVIPGIFSKDIFIDFGQLRRDGATISSAEAFFYDENEDVSPGGGANEDLGVLANRYEFTENGFGEHTGNGADFVRIPNGAVRWSYMLENENPSDPVTSLYEGSTLEFPYYRLNNLLSERSLSFIEDSNSSLFRRNRVARRYVVVWANPFTRTGDMDNGTALQEQMQTGRLPSFIPAQFNSGNPVFNSNQIPRVSSPDNDPFLIHRENVCVSNDANNHPESWFAIAMDFNEDGEFLGYLTRYCAQSQVGTSAPFFTVVATLNDQCVDFVQTHNQQNIFVADANKAWTNRLWAGNDPASESPFFQSSYLRLDTDNRPHGSLALSDNLEAYSDQSLRGYSFGSFRFVEGDTTSPYGFPYNCSYDSWFGGMVIADSTIRSCGGISYLPQTSSQSSGSLVREDRVRPELARDIQASTQNSNNVFEGLSHLFATSYRRRTLENQNYTYPANSNNYDFSNSTTGIYENLRPPQIYSLNPATCNETRQEVQGAGCTAAEVGSFSLDGRNFTLSDYNGDGQADEDLNFDNSPDSIIAVGSKTVSLQFFATADDNRMPIERVKIDWGDGRPPENRLGLYKNRKPYCQEDSSEIGVGLCLRTLSSGSSDFSELTNLTCQNNSDCAYASESSGDEMSCVGTSESAYSAYTSARFGNTTRACEPRPFTKIHEYTCTTFDVDPSNSSPPSYVNTVGSIGDADVRNRLIGEFGLLDDSRVCIFNPRVQVVDNWGWCNTPDGSRVWGDGPDQACGNPNSSNPIELIRENTGVSAPAPIYVIPPSN